MEIVNDLLDKQILDCDGVRMGRVDGVVIACGVDGVARVVAIEIGAVALAMRIGPRCARACAWIARRLGGPARERPIRIAWRDVADVGLDVRLAIAVERTAAHDWQRALRERLFERRR